MDIYRCELYIVIDNSIVSNK